MKLNFSAEWYQRAVENESTVTVGAGALAHNSDADDVSAKSEMIFEEARIAFGKFVALSRRKKQLSVEALAQASELDIEELIAIEQLDAHFVPEPRTVFQLAEFFKVPYEKLLEIAGLKSPKNPALIGHAIKFAARSASVDKLSNIELRALEELVLALSEPEE